MSATARSNSENGHMDTRKIRAAIEGMDDAQLSSIGVVRASAVETEPPAAVIYPEILAAAKWWSDQLRAPMVKMDSGESDPMALALTFAAASTKTVVDEARLGRFERWLAWLIQVGATRIDRFGSTAWNPDKPEWGSATEYRSIGVDYGPDRPLACAITLAGIRASIVDLPIKTHMWISPGCVKVRHGYRSSETIIYPEKPR